MEAQVNSCKKLHRRHSLIPAAVSHRGCRSLLHSICHRRRLCSSDPEIPKLSEEDQEKEFRWPELEDQNVANYWTGTAAGRESPRIGLHSICLRNFGYEIMPATSSHFLGKCLDGRCMSVMLTGHFIRGNGNADAVVHILSQLKAWNFTWGRRAAANIVQMHALYMSLAYRLKSNMIHAEAWPGF